MTTVASGLQPDSNPELYVSSVFMLYVDLPDTPLRASNPDYRLARSWFERRVPVSLVETALLLASLRRLARPRELPPLPRIRSLAYFQPIVDELLETPLPAGYLDYLRVKFRGLNDRAEPNRVPKNTISDDR
jgi:hypothetical protein